MAASDALRTAVLEQSETLVLELLQSGVDPTLNDSEALLNAVTYSDRENIINLLIQYGARANQGILNTAAARYDENIIEKLLHHGANAKELGNYNENALHQICHVFTDKAIKVCELLIKNGAEVNQESQICRITPLWKALDRGNNKVVEVLLEYGAQPCREMDAPMGIGVPLEYSFSLKASTIESMIKYAALQVNSSDEREVQKFFQYIANGRTRDSALVPNICRKYRKFARDCMGEINTLREKILNEERVSLFDFVVSQGDVLETYRSNDTVIKSALSHVTSTPFPIYCEVILKKLKRNMIICKLLEAPVSQWCYNFEGIEKSVNTDCIELITAYLSVIDLGYLFMALNSAL